MSTGEPVVVRAAMKPLATLNRPTLATVDTATKEPGVSFKERTDVTAVPALGVVAETWWRWSWPTRPPASSVATPWTSSCATTARSSPPSPRAPSVPDGAGRRRRATSCWSG